LETFCLYHIGKHNRQKLRALLGGQNQMNYGKLATCCAIFFFIISLSSNVIADGSINIKWGKGSESGDYAKAHKNKKGGPPEHAPAHGYRAKHKYRYYPSKSVYYDTGRGLYFYLKGDNWEVGASLPSKLKAGLGDSVTFELDTATPYIHHAEHAMKYGPKSPQNKKKNNGKRG
jgi:hypothetical protein